jgi:hypothetical protein
VGLLAGGCFGSGSIPLAECGLAIPPIQVIYSMAGELDSFVFHLDFKQPKTKKQKTQQERKTMAASIQGPSPKQAT